MSTAHRDDPGSPEGPGSPEDPELLEATLDHAALKALVADYLADIPDAKVRLSAQSVRGLVSMVEFQRVVETAQFERARIDYCFEGVDTRDSLMSVGDGWKLVRFRERR